MFFLPASLYRSFIISPVRDREFLVSASLIVSLYYFSFAAFMKRGI